MGGRNLAAATTAKGMVKMGFLERGSGGIYSIRRCRGVQNFGGVGLIGEVMFKVVWMDRLWPTIGFPSHDTDGM
jgi:hypothetical protein